MRITQTYLESLLSANSQCPPKLLATAGETKGNSKVTWAARRVTATRCCSRASCTPKARQPVPIWMGNNLNSSRGNRVVTLDFISIIRPHRIISKCITVREFVIILEIWPPSCPTPKLWIILKQSIQLYAPPRLQHRDVRSLRTEIRVSQPFLDARTISLLLSSFLNWVTILYRNPPTIPNEKATCQCIFFTSANNGFTRRSAVRHD